MAIIVLSRPQMQSAFNQLLIALCFFDSIFLILNIPEDLQALGIEGKWRDFSLEYEAWLIWYGVNVNL